MLSITVPSAGFHEIGFAPEAEYRRELAAGTAPPLLDKLSMVPPVVIGLTPEQAESDTRVASYLKDNAAQYKFSLVHFKVGFAPAADEPITLAVVEVSLDKGTGPATPIVIAMDPEKVADMTDLKRDLEGKIDLDIAGTKLGFSVKRGTERPGGELFLVAAGIGQSHAGWEINETPSVKVGGILVFNLILQTPAGQTSNGRVAVTAQVRRKHFGLIPYRALLDNTPTGQFAC
jgi:hypothetical protein